MLFRGTQDGRVLAYDFKTGKQVWDDDHRRPETRRVGAVGADRLGTASSSSAMRAETTRAARATCIALDAKTGKIVWEFFLVPKAEGDVVRGPLGASPLDTSTWKNAPGIPISGGGTWTSYTLDTENGLLYVPGGNPAPDFAIGAREGENFYSDSVVVLDAKTGDYKNHFKIVPKDWHDWDVSNPPILIQTMGGKQLMSVAPKDGYLYGFDLATNSLLYRVPVTTIENADGNFRRRAEPFISVRARWAARNGTARPTIRSTNLVLIGDGRLVRHGHDRRLTRTSVGSRRPAMDRNGDVQPVQHVRQGRPYRRTLGRMGLCRRRRHRRLEVAR